MPGPFPSDEIPIAHFLGSMEISGVWNRVYWHRCSKSAEAVQRIADLG